VTLAWIAVVLTLPLQVGAQEPGLVRGRVIDQQTLTPVGLAFVAQVTSDRGVLTDALGQFALPIDPAFPSRVQVTVLGYRVLQTDIPAGRAGQMLTVMLEPDPVEIEGLTVLAERLADRRRGAYGVADILEREQLLAAPDASGYELIRRMLPFVQPCGPDTEALCLGGRGIRSERRTVSVCFDGHQIPESMIQTSLSPVDPTGLYLVEVYSRVGAVHMYSPGYMKRLIQEGPDLPPLSFGCRDAGIR
jgi:hypothetical protein